MSKNDKLQRFILENTSVRGEIVHLHQSFETIISQHQYPPLIRQILGELLVAAALLSATIKFKGRLTVQLQGKGKLKLLLAQCDNEFNIRGLAQWRSALTADELLEAFQDSVLAIIIQPSTTSSKSYQGVVAWQGNSIARSIEGYFKDSEQLPTRIWIAVDEHKAAGLLLQLMPPSKGFKNEEGEPRDQGDWEQLIHLTETVTPAELLHLENEVLLRRLYTHDNEVRLFDSVDISFKCTCSVARSENAVLLLGREEAEAELQGKQRLVVSCDFCGQEYVFDRVDVERIFKQQDGSSTHLH